MVCLGVNIDHIANIREARKTVEPDPVQLAFLAELGGADGITVHLREDRRHIQNRDVRLLKETIRSRLNLEMAATEEMLEIAIITKPDMVTLVPEKRYEITTEGGLEVERNKNHLQKVIKKLRSHEIKTSLFIDPSPNQIKSSSDIGSDYIELHTGSYAIFSGQKQILELAKLKEGVARAKSMGLYVNAGHGLTYQNVEPIASIKGIEELNIGHTIIARSIAIGLQEAVKEMKALIKNPRQDIIVDW